MFYAEQKFHINYKENKTFTLLPLVCVEWGKMKHHSDPRTDNVDQAEPTAPINIRNERLEGISLTHNLEEERTPRSVCMHLYLINLYVFNLCYLLS